MIRIYFNGVLECGAYVQNACVFFDEEPTMVGLINAIKEKGYIMCKLPHMPKLVKI